MAFLAWWLPYDMGVRPEPVVALCATAAAALLLLAATTAAARGRLAGPGRRGGGRRRPHRRGRAARRAGGGPAAAGPGAARRPRSVPGSADPRGRIPLPVLRAVAVGSALATALLLGFADGALRDFLRGQAVTGAVFTPDGWADEAGRYAFLLDPIPMGSFARRAAVLTCLLALAWFAVLAVAARARRVPLPAPLRADRLRDGAGVRVPRAHPVEVDAPLRDARRGRCRVPRVAAGHRGAADPRRAPGRPAAAGGAARGGRLRRRGVRAGLARARTPGRTPGSTVSPPRTCGRPWAALTLDHPLLWLALLAVAALIVRRVARPLDVGRAVVRARAARRRGVARRVGGRPPSGCSPWRGSAAPRPDRCGRRTSPIRRERAAAPPPASACSTWPARRRSCPSPGRAPPRGSPPAAASSRATARRRGRCGGR